MQGLALLVQQHLRRDPHAGDLDVFRGRAGGLVKIIWYDGIGMSLYAKRLERGRFIWPSVVGGTVALTAAQLEWNRPRSRPSPDGYQCTPARPPEIYRRERSCAGCGSVRGPPATAQQNAGWDKVFPQNEHVEHQKVSFNNRLGIALVADLYVPKAVDRSRRHPAIAVGRPFGGVKEQIAGLYAQTLAERGLTYKALRSPKELHIVSSAGHVDLYDKINLIPWDKLAAAGAANRGSVRVVKNAYIWPMRTGLCADLTTRPEHVRRLVCGKIFELLLKAFGALIHEIPCQLWHDRC